MRDYSERELLLQNLLATAATLVYRASRAMGENNLVAQKVLVIECETWFSETKESLSAALASGATAPVIPTPAPPAGNNGDVWKSPPVTREKPGLIPPGLVKNTETPSTEGVPSYKESAGGISPARVISTKPSNASAMAFFGMKP